jgi:hypothetical protein
LFPRERFRDVLQILCCQQFSNVKLHLRVLGATKTDVVDEGMDGVQPYRSNPNDNTAKDAPTFKLQHADLKIIA